LIGGIDEVDAAIDGAIEHHERFVLRCVRPEVHRSEAQLTDLEFRSSELANNARCPFLVEQADTKDPTFDTP